jgi:hypothetical protein
MATVLRRRGDVVVWGMARLVHSANQQQRRFPRRGCAWTQAGALTRQATAD